MSQEFAHHLVNYSSFLIDSIKDRAINRILDKFPRFLQSEAYKRSSSETRWNIVEEDVSYYVANIIAHSNQIKEEDRQEVYDVVLNEVKDVITANILDKVESEEEVPVNKFDSVKVRDSIDNEEYIVNNMVGEYCNLNNKGWIHSSNLEIVSKYKGNKEKIDYKVGNLVNYDGEEKAIRKIEGTTLILSDGNTVEKDHPLLKKVSHEFTDDIGGDEYFETDTKYDEGFQTVSEKEVDSILEEIERMIHGGNYKEALVQAAFLPEEKQFDAIRQVIDNELNED